MKLNAYVYGNDMDSDKHMPYVMMANLVSENETTGLSRNMLMLGRKTFGLIYEMSPSI